MLIPFPAMEIPIASANGGPRARTTETPPASAEMLVASVAWTESPVLELTLPPEM